jgi:hypothetical protein
VANETTEYGYIKPDGNELIRDGDNVIATNAQVADNNDRNLDFRLASIEALAEPPVATEPRPSNLALAPDGVPYILPGANEIQAYAGNDGHYYFTAT